LERELKVSEEELAEIYNNTPVIIILVDKDRRVRKANRLALEFAGRSQNEIFGLRGGEALRCLNSLNSPQGCGFSPECQVCAVRNTVLDTLETGVDHYNVEAKLPFIRGEEINELNLLISTSSLIIGGEKLVLASINDNTSSKNAEEKAIKEREKAELYLNLVSEIIVALDDDGIITLMNKKGHEILGYEEGELNGKNWFKTCLPPHDRDRVYDYFKKLMNGEMDVIEFYENPIYTKDGHERLIAWSTVLLKDRNGKITGLLSSGEDITEHNKAEAELKESEVKYKLIFEVIRDALYLIDQENGAVLDVNKAAESMYGYSREEWLTMKNTDVSAEPTKTQKATIDLPSHIPIRYHKKKDGTVFPIEMVVNSFILKDKRLIIATGRDITERRKAEKVISNLARFPSENPNPILRVTKESILYLNKVSESIFSTKEGDPLPELFQDAVIEAININTIKEIEIELNNRIYAIEIIPIKEEGYANLYARDITEHKKVEEEIGERVKELNCLYSVSKIVEKEVVEIEEMLTKAVELLPLAWQFSEVVCARIVVDGHKYKTKNYKDTNWKQSSNIIVNKEKVGLIEVIYLEEIPEFDDGPFLKEERHLIDELAKILGSYFERKKSDNALKESEDFSKSLLRSMMDGLSILDENGVHLDINPAFCKMTGFSREELIGTSPPHPYWPEEEYQNIEEAFQKTLEEKQIEFELIFKRKNGERFPVLVNPASIKDKNGNIISYFATVRDNTERVKTKKTLQESEEKYRNAYNRAEFYKDLFSHDINNILQSILSGILLNEIYINKPEGHEKLKETNNIIKDQVKRGANLVLNIRKLSQLEDPKIALKSIEICSFLEKSITFVKNSYKTRNINIQVDSIGEKFYVQGNEFLEDAFENVLINAVKYNESLNKEILIKISREQINGINYLKIEFKDNGIGIDDDKKKLIFQKGYMEGKSVSGMGLGLSLVKKIIETYNGDIWVEDRIKGDQSKGSNFIVLIPEVS